MSFSVSFPTFVLPSNVSRKENVVEDFQLLEGDGIQDSLICFVSPTQPSRPFRKRHVRHILSHDFEESTHIYCDVHT